MNFSAFQSWREQCLRTNNVSLDCAETNLYRSLAFLQPKPDKQDGDCPVHRCDLARAWLVRYGFPNSSSRRALVCRGVRHALTLIFRTLALTRTQLWLPNDVYPIYLELAREVGIEPRFFSTLPQPMLPTHQPDDGGVCLLITNPWKPLGRYLTNEECDMLANWLDGSPHRLLIMDCVYDLHAPFHATTLKLQATGRTILLHSVTKGWLWPKTFGIALVGEDGLQFASAFRNDSPAPDQLNLARQLFSTDADCPSRVANALQSRAKALFAGLPETVRTSLLPVTGDLAKGSYFFPVKMSAEDLFGRHRVIGIPASAFGGKWEGSILTSLSESFAPKEGGAS